MKGVSVPRFEHFTRCMWNQTSQCECGYCTNWTFKHEQTHGSCLSPVSLQPHRGPLAHAFLLPWDFIHVPELSKLSSESPLHFLCIVSVSSRVRGVLGDTWHDSPDPWESVEGGRRTLEGLNNVFCPPRAQLDSEFLSSLFPQVKLRYIKKG